MRNVLPSFSVFNRSFRSVSLPFSQGIAVSNMKWLAFAILLSSPFVQAEPVLGKLMPRLLKIIRLEVWSVAIDSDNT